MQITLVTQPFAGIETDALVSYIFEDADPVQGSIAQLDQTAGGLLRKLAKSGELTGKMLEFTLIHAPAGLKAGRLLLVGAGKREQFSGATLRKISGAALRYLKSRSVKNFAFLVREGDERLVVDVIDPHDHTKPDALGKAQGLSAYAAKHGDQFGHIAAAGTRAVRTKASESFK